jgi:hypothetical protein
MSAARSPHDAGTSPSPRPDKAAMRSALDALFAPDDVIELRAIYKRRKRTGAGYFDGEHREGLVNAATELNAAGAAIYVTLNRIDPQILGRCCNRVQDYAKATVTDKDVVRRRWLLTDFDPVRPTDTSATDVQVAAARARVSACYQALKAEGWPRPLVGESGNGYHLLYPLDLPNDAESTALVKGALAGLAARFDDEVVKVDQTVFNAGRITKLYGTVATKGDHTPLTPWRLSQLVSRTDRDVAVTADQLRALHPKANGSDPKVGSAFGGTCFDLPAFLMRLGIACDQDVHEGADRYRLDHCPFNPEHGWGEAAIFQQPDGRLGFKCQHSSCADKHWEDVRALVDGPREARGGAPHGARQSSTKAAGENSGAGHSDTNGQAQGGTGAPAFLTAAALWDMRHDPTRWAVPEILPEGVCILAGKPKVGKSWLALDVSIAVGTGGRALGAIEVEAGPVLYLALEDTKRRLTKRLRFLCGDTTPPPQQIEFLTDCPRLGSGGEEVLREWLRDHPTARLVVIDTLPRFRPPTNAKETLYANDYVVGEYLSRLCVEHQVSILLLGHLRKQPGDDPIDEISGTLGLVGSVDGYMVLRRQAMSDEATLYVCGRDVDEPAERCLSWDRPCARWRTTGGDPRVSRLPAEQRRAYDLLSEAPRTITELTEALNPGHVVTDLSNDQKYKNTSKLIYKLRDRELVYQRPFDKRWALLTTQTQGEEEEGEEKKEGEDGECRGDGFSFSRGSPSSPNFRSQSRLETR